LPPPSGAPIAVALDEQTQWTGFARAVFLNIMEHGVYTGQQAPAPFVPQFSADERRIAIAPATMYTFCGLDGGGSALNPVAAAGFTFADTALGVGYVVGSAIANHRAKQAAAPQWRLDGQGTITIADHGIYFPNPSTGVVIPIPYSICTSCVLTHSDRLETESPHKI
jgi:hypothetical protein